MDWLTRLYLCGRVTLVLDTRNARPAFPPWPDECDCDVATRLYTSK